MCSCLINVKAPVTGPEVAVAGHHPKSFCVNLAMGENIACRSAAAVHWTMVLCAPDFLLATQLFREGGWVPDRESELAQEGVGEEVVPQSMGWVAPTHGYQWVCHVRR